MVECQFAYTKCTGDGKTCPSQVNLRFACVSKVMSSGHSETPKKVYKGRESVNVSCYRHCKAVGDTSHKSLAKSLQQRESTTSGGSRGALWPSTSTK